MYIHVHVHVHVCVYSKSYLSLCSDVGDCLIEYVQNNGFLWLPLCQLTGIIMNALSRPVRQCGQGGPWPTQLRGGVCSLLCVRLYMPLPYIYSW